MYKTKNHAKREQVRDFTVVAFTSTSLSTLAKLILFWFVVKLVSVMSVPFRADVSVLN